VDVIKIGKVLSPKYGWYLCTDFIELRWMWYCYCRNQTVSIFPVQILMFGIPTITCRYNKNLFDHFFSIKMLQAYVWISIQICFSPHWRKDELLNRTFTMLLCGPILWRFAFKIYQSPILLTINRIKRSGLCVIRYVKVEIPWVFVGSIFSNYLNFCSSCRFLSEHLKSAINPEG
jgi:hypothetical protein